jgi:uncharacterized protein YjbI with pentapeptide repeats
MALSSAKLLRVTFYECDLRDANFIDTDFKFVRFVNCKLERATFSKTKFLSSSFRRCDLSGVRGIENLRGASMGISDIVSSAMLFAHELGITSLGDDVPE